jgi:hypothetical protein
MQVRAYFRTWLGWVDLDGRISEMVEIEKTASVRRGFI